MIIEFSCSNMLSFKENVTLSFVPGKEKLNAYRLSVVKKLKFKVNPLAVLFGPNASGKTNFIKNLAFVKRLVLKQPVKDSLIGVTPFLFDANSKSIPSMFALTFLAQNDDVYTLNVELNNQEILFEELTLRNSADKRVLYTRKKDKIDFNLIGSKDDIKSSILTLVKSNLEKNRLFLNSAGLIVINSFKELRNAYSWFERLTIVSPDTNFLAMLSKFIDISKIAQLLQSFGIDVDSIDLMDYPPDNLPQPLQRQLDNLPQNQNFCALINKKDFVIANIENGEKRLRKLSTLHKINDNVTVRLDLGEESDGTKRLIELFPILFALNQDDDHNAVYVIDELDRSLHTLLTRAIIKNFMTSRYEDSRKQLIFTCHDALLFDDECLRTDQMVIFDKARGYTQATKMNEIEGVRNGRDLVKLYLSGQLGGVPKIKTI